MTLTFAALYIYTRSDDTLRRIARGEGLSFAACALENLMSRVYVGAGGKLFLGDPKRTYNIYI